MYVHPVIVGVIGTLLVELVILIGLAIWKNSGKAKQGGKEHGLGA